jgi:cytochrome c biogenesis factor
MAAERTLRHILAASYAWILSVFAGNVILDIVYSRLLDRVEDFPTRSSIYAEVSDFLLLIGAIMVVLALAAIVSSWSVAPARNLFIASILLILIFEFLVPVVLFPFLRDSSGTPADSIGPWLRLVPVVLASFCSFWGLRQFYQKEP